VGLWGPCPPYPSLRVRPQRGWPVRQGRAVSLDVILQKGSPAGPLPRPGRPLVTSDAKARPSSSCCSSAAVARPHRQAGAASRTAPSHGPGSGRSRVIDLRVRATAITLGRIRSMRGLAARHRHVVRGLPADLTPSPETSDHTARGSRAQPRVADIRRH